MVWINFIPSTLVKKGGYTYIICVMWPITQYTPMFGGNPFQDILSLLN